MKHYRMKLDGYLLAIVSEEEIGNNKGSLEAAGYDFVETKVSAPIIKVSLEFVCAACEYKMWIFDFDAETDVEVNAECDMCGTKHTLVKQEDGTWRVGVVPVDQVVMHDESEV